MTEDTVQRSCAQSVFFGVEDFDFFCQMRAAGWEVLVDGPAARAVAGQQTNEGRDEAIRADRPNDAADRIECLDETRRNRETRRLAVEEPCLGCDHAAKGFDIATNDIRLACNALVQSEQNPGGDVVAVHDCEAEVGKQHRRQLLLRELPDHFAKRALIPWSVDPTRLNDHEGKALSRNPKRRLMSKHLGLLITRCVTVARVFVGFVNDAPLGVAEDGAG